MNEHIKTVIEKYRTNPELINNISKKPRLSILEHVGIHLTDHDELLKKVKDISNKIKDYYSIPENKHKTDAQILTDYEHPLYNESKSINVKFFHCDLNISKIKRLFIFVTQ